MSSIRLHSKHGLNPTMPVCFFCGEETGEIALLGAAYKDEAPRHMIMNKEPCEKCKAGMKLGITFMECEERKGPTGRFVVIKEDAVKHMINDPNLLNDILEKRMTYVRPADWNQIFGDTSDGK